MLLPASSCIGRGSDGRDVGASFDIYAALAWATYPFELPCDVAMQSGQLALDALGGDLAQIDFFGRQLALTAEQNVFFPLSQLGLSLADYLVLSKPITDANTLASFFGLASFGSEAVTLAPSAISSTSWAFQSAKFAKRMDLEADGLRDLVYQDLGPSEISAGIQAGTGLAVAGPGESWKGFFINGYQQTDANILALRTQYVPVGRYAFDFGSTTTVAFPPLKVAGSFTITFWLYLDKPQSATILAIGKTMQLALSNVASPTTLSFSASNVSVPPIDLSAFTANRQWLSVAVVFDSEAPPSMTFYINGQSLGATRLEAQLAWPSDAASGLTLGAGLSGCICDLAIWNRALGAGEINAGFQRPAMQVPAAQSPSPVPSGLLTFWPLNDDTTGSNLTVRNWTSSANTGTLSQQVTWTAVGLPENVTNPPPAATSILQDGLSFIETELLTGSVPPGGSGQPGVTLINLDCINRFVRLAQRLEWSFADLEWVLFTLTPPSDSKHPVVLATPNVTPGVAIADLVKLTLLASQLSLGIPETCTFFGPLKPFGRGRLGDTLPLFDRVYNRPPLEATVFAPVMSLVIALQDFETPGPIARRLAAMLALIRASSPHSRRGSRRPTPSPSMRQRSPRSIAIARLPVGPGLTPIHSWTLSTSPASRGSPRRWLRPTCGISF